MFIVWTLSYLCLFMLGWHARNALTRYHHDKFVREQSERLQEMFNAEQEKKEEEPETTPESGPILI